MTDILEEMEKLVEAGLCQKHGQDGYSLTDAGKDFFESVIQGGVEAREHVYALGRLQGLREAEKENSND